MGALRRRRGPVLFLSFGLLLAISACSATTATPESDQGAALPQGLNPEPGTEIPTQTIAVGLTPYGDELIPVIGARQGYFEDAGISFTEPDGLKTDLAESLTPLLNGQIEIGSGYMPVVTPQLDTVDTVTAFAISNVFLGNRILAPEGKYETVADLMDQGMDFEEAAAQVVEQLRGKSLLLPEGIVPTFYDIALGTADMTLGDVDTTYLSNPDIVLAAQAGRADFVSPDGAVQITQLQESGWESLIEIDQMVDALPDETLSLRTTHSAYLTTNAYAADNYNTLLRFTGVIYRIIDELQTDPVAAASIYGDYLNSYTGSSLSDQEIAGMFENGIYSLRGFDDAGDFVETAGSPVNFYETAQAQIDLLTTQGVLKGDHDSDDMAIASRVYSDLVEYRDLTDELLADGLTGELADQARAYYDAYNFVDAYRFALAAKDA